MAAAKSTEPIPTPFLEVRVRRLDLAPALIGLCVGYEGGRWRSKELVDHVMEWLPDFALNYTERRSFGADSAVRLIRAAARSIYKTKKFENRGEFGELFLHIAIRQVFDTVPAISKMYYKDSDNSTVKGFDGVHVVVTPSTLELWLGESKFYDNISRAIADVVAELKDHTEALYLRREFATIHAHWPHADRLKKLLDPNTSLDSVFDAVSIPVLLTYDSSAINNHEKITEEYIREFSAEVEHYRETFASKELPKLRVHFISYPVEE
jgi:hypothetical protein